MDLIEFMRTSMDSPPSREWRSVKESLERRIGEQITVLKYTGAGKSQKSQIRVKATIIKPYDEFVLVEIRQRHCRYKESFLYADFFTGLQPRNGIVFDEAA